MPLPDDYPVTPQDELALVELLNRVLDRGAVISGDVVISVAGVDLLYVGLRVVLASVESMVAREHQLRESQLRGNQLRDG